LLSPEDVNEQAIRLWTVNELRSGEDGAPRRFFIPAYQRGYRWSPLQVRQLLNDVREFTYRPHPEPEEFYCLQPLVVTKRPSDEYEVVDGQQRLTTLFLILRHFNDRLAEKYRQASFTLTYQTRPRLEQFLAAPDINTAGENIDFFHVYQAIRTIEEWFADHESEVEDIKSSLLNKTKVIWFELAEGDNPVGAFTRLNVGKIPLTSDELIRALFLRRARPDKGQANRQQMQIAQEWDQIEKSLQSDAFWYFLSNDRGSRRARIGFLFDLVVKAHDVELAQHDEYALFYAFGNILSSQVGSPEDLWREVKQTFLMLEEWFEDRRLFHMIGFLVSQGMTIHEIRELSEGCTKSDFDGRLRTEIYQRVIGEDIPDTDRQRRVAGEQIGNRLAELDYRSDAAKVRAVLLLFNVATLLRDWRSNLRFQFDSYKRQRWDIEHIRSVTDARPDRPHDRRAWMEHCLGYFESMQAEPDLRERISRYLGLPQVEATRDEFDLLYDQLLTYFNEQVGAVAEHGIGNLTLLDVQTNRGYKNAVFAVKRWQLLQLDQAGIFVPLCTRNAFLKCYSPQVSHAIVWSEDDQNEYEGAIGEVLTDFFVGPLRSAA
jgi:hypothetical protein